MLTARLDVDLRKRYLCRLLWQRDNLDHRRRHPCQPIPVEHLYRLQRRRHQRKGVVNVDGAGSTWTSNDTLYLGGGPNSGYGGNRTGTLSITNGGRVSNSRHWLYRPLGR